MSTKNLTPVLKTSFVLLAILVLLGIVMPDGYQVWSEQLREVISDKLGWFYLLLVTSIVLLCGFFLVSPVGQIKLGEPNSVPEHSTISWIAMIFSAGMGIGLVFYGAAEPLSHYAISTVRATPGSQEALADAFRYTFFHWGIHAWAIYALIALALAYFGFRKKEKYLLSVTLKPLFGKKTNGILGKIVDTITVVATVIGVATTLGFGAAQINGGTQLPLWYSKQCPCASYYHNYHNHPLYHFSPFWSWKRGKNLIKHQSYFSGWTTRHHHNHRSHSPDF